MPSDKKLNRWLNTLAPKDMAMRDLRKGRTTNFIKNLANYEARLVMGLGVHRTFEISFPFPTPSQLVPRCITSARLLADVPRLAVLSNNLRAAGVNKPG